MRYAILPIALLLTCAACDDADEAPPENPAPSTDALYACEESDFQEILPLTGPGVGEDGQLIMPSEDVIVHTTLLIAHAGKENEVIQRSLAVVEASRGIDGFLAVAAARSERCGFLRTYGIWRDQSAMYALLATDVHTQAVLDTTELSATGKTSSWSASPSEATSFGWTEAQEALRDVAPSPAYQ